MTEKLSKTQWGTSCPPHAQGFTLIELLLYVSLSVMILGICSIFLFVVQEAKIRNQVAAEVDQQGVQVLGIMAQTVRNAKSILTPSSGSSSNISFSVNTQSPLYDPTIFDLSNGVLRMQQGAGATVDITSPKVTISGVTFTNLTRTGTNGILKIEFTMTYINHSGRNEYNYSKTFYDSVSLR